jgi:hypothetical protein
MGPDQLLELLSAVVNRSPQYTRALSQPGLQNKGNATAAALHEELNNFLTDIPTKMAGRAGGGLIGAGIGSFFGPAGTATGGAIGQAVGPHAANLLKDALWANYVTPHVYKGWDAANPAGKAGLNNYPHEADALISPTIETIDKHQPMHYATTAADKYITQPVKRYSKEQVDNYVKSLKYKPDYRITPAQLREIGMQK